MDINKILSADILDIIFEGRNKDYGAYDLRKTYNSRITKAIIATIAVCLIIVVGTFLAKAVKKEATQQILVQDVQLKDIKKEEPKVEPPPPPPPKVEPPKIEMKQFTPPKIVKDEEVKEPPPKQEELNDIKIDVKNQEGEKSDIVAPPVEDKGTGVVEAPKVVEEDYDKEFKSVQIEAQFPGGQAAWNKFLERNLNNQTPSDNGAAPGNYTVTVSFLVDKDGNISEVTALDDPGYGTASEAVRAIKKGPKWKPAVQNGRNVIYRQKQRITFQVTEE